MSESGGRQLLAILSADAVGYSALMGADEQTAVALLRQRRETLSSAVADHHGRVIDAVGDNLLALFPSAVAAVACAVAVQQRIAADLEDGQRLQLRIGVNLGDVRLEGSEVFGEAVNVAARLEAKADAGGVCISHVVRDQLRGRASFEFVPLGALRLKNIAEPVQAYRVLVPQHASDASSHAETLGTQTRREVHSVAVLPFEDLSDAAGETHLAGGLTEDLITLLAGTPGILVIARTSTIAYAGRPADVRTIGRELGALYVVEGSIRRLGERVRVTVQLIDAETGTHLWARRYDRLADELFNLEDELVASIAAQLQPELVRAEAQRAARTPPESLDAWALYHQALDALYMRGESAEQRAEGERLLARALELDPEFPPARVMSAALKVTRASISASDEDERAGIVRAAQAEGRRAMEQAPDDPMVLHHWATVQREVEGPEVSIPILERALALGWNDPQGWASLGLHLARGGRLSEAIDRVEHAIRLSPSDPRRWAWEQFLANTHLRGRSWDAALRHAERATALNDGFPVGWVVRTGILVRAGRMDEARRCLARALERAPGLGLTGVESAWRATIASDDALCVEFLGYLRQAGME